MKISIVAFFASICLTAAENIVDVRGLHGVAANRNLSSNDSEPTSDTSEDRCLSSKDSEPSADTREYRPIAFILWIYCQ